jgi:hypothetical protein
MTKLTNKEYKEPVIVNIDKGDFENTGEWARLMKMLEIDQDPETVGTLNLTVTEVNEWDFGE